MRRRAISKYALDRRTVLRGMAGGAAVSLGLPLLEAMLDVNGDALAGGQALPTRFMTWFWGNGVYLPVFEPTTTGPSWVPTQPLQPFADLGVKEYVNVCTGLKNRCRTLITHHEGMCAFNGWDIQPFNGPKPFNSHMGGPTIDQLVADAIQGDTPIRSIHMGLDRKLSTADGGTTLAALSHIGTNQPEYPEHNPQTVWTLLFGGYMPVDDKPLRLRIVDAVKDDLGRMKTRLGSLDQQILDKHLDGIVELENKINTLPPPCQTPMQPTETNPDIPNQPIDLVHDIFVDMIATAFRCDITRVATFLFHYGASHFHFWQIGQDAYENHNDNSHMGGGNWQARYVAANQFCMQQLAKLAARLRDEVEPNGDNLLDSSIIYASSDCGVGWTHSINRQPIVIVGHGRNRLQYPGIHYQAVPYGGTNDYPTSSGNMSDVLLTLLQCFDPAATSIGDLGGPSTPPGSTTPLEDIRA
jgi:hypothetical protein